MACLMAYLKTYLEALTAENRRGLVILYGYCLTPGAPGPEPLQRIAQTIVYLVTLEMVTWAPPDTLLVSKFDCGYRETLPQECFAGNMQTTVSS